jgi:hypothetical protein
LSNIANHKETSKKVEGTRHHNPSYSGGRDQKDCGSKPPLANSSTRPNLEKTLHKKELVDWLKV